LYNAPILEKLENLKMLSLMDTNLTRHPTEGLLSMVDWLQERGYPGGPKRVRRMFRLMRHETIYRRKNLTRGALKQFIKPYLLRGLRIERANQIWCTDITYIPMAKGFMCMTAFIDVPDPIHFALDDVPNLWNLSTGQVYFVKEYIQKYPANDARHALRP
jgi:putative transposase